MQLQAWAELSSLSSQMSIVGASRIPPPQQARSQRPHYRILTTSAMPGPLLGRVCCHVAAYTFSPWRRGAAWARRCTGLIDHLVNNATIGTVPQREHAGAETKRFC